MTTFEEPPVFDARTEATLLAEALVAASVNSRIYAIDHPRVTNAMRDVRERVAAICEVQGTERLRVGALDRMLVFDRRPLLGASLGITRLVEALEAIGAGGVEFDRATDDDDLLQFFRSLVARDDEPGDFAQRNRTLVERGCRTVRYLPPYTDGVDAEFAAPVRLDLTMQQKVMEVLQTVTVSLCRGGRIDFAPVQAHVERMLARLRDQSGLQLGLSRKDQYDAFTFGHSLRVAILALNFARTLTDDEELLLRVGTAALLHDVGKSLIPFEILHSQRQLDDDERREMNRHAELGGECLLDHDDADPLAVAAAFGHHRTAKGGGYPRTTHEHPVSMVTAIVKICDIFEALTAARPYKQPMSPIRAYRVMIAMGDALDRKLLRRFLEVNGVYPTGQHVELHDGRVAVVRDQTDDLLRPRVALLSPDDVDTPFEQDHDLLDLSQIECGCARAILQELTPTEAGERVRDGANERPRG